jgi:hypothetical protein
MQFDINEVITNMANAIKGSVANDWNFIKDDVQSYLSDRKGRLQRLADRRIKNQITDEFLAERLADENDMMVSELYSLKLISKVMAQNAVNAAIGVLTDAINAALKL